MSKNYDNLLKDIQNMLFEKHTHGDSVTEDDIVYKENDVIEIINNILSLSRYPK